MFAMLSRRAIHSWNRQLASVSLVTVEFICLQYQSAFLVDTATSVNLGVERATELLRSESLRLNLWVVSIPTIDNSMKGKE